MFYTIDVGDFVMQPILKVTNLSKYYGCFLGIKDVSLILWIIGFMLCKKKDIYT